MDSSIAREAIDGVLDLIYPPRCLVCGTIGAPYFCAECVDQVESIPRPYCRRCGHPSKSTRCRDCGGMPRSFTTARAAGVYSGPLRKAVHEFKYGGHRMLAEPLGQLLFDYLSHDSDFPWESADLLIPIPIHHTRKRLRGYNQSELLAEEISRLTGKPVMRDAVSRTVNTRPQVSLSEEGRRCNIRNAFSVSDNIDLKKKVILLIDDVATTCSTVHECSLALLKGGAARVYVACLAFDL